MGGLGLGCSVSLRKCQSGGSRQKNKREGACREGLRGLWTQVLESELGCGAWGPRCLRVLQHPHPGGKLPPLPVLGRT